MLYIKDFIKRTLLFVTLIVSLFLLSCNSNEAPKLSRVEDTAAKKKLQGTWINEFEGNPVFYIKGDTIFYNDSLSSPVAFYVSNDTLFVENHKEARYPIKKLNSSSFVFVNDAGDEVTLAKSEVNGLSQGEYKGAVHINQGRKVKNDTVMIYDDKHYHAYTQINPTRYKVYKQSPNNEGLQVESVYYDNLVHLSVFIGQRKIYGQNIMKNDFSKLVPKEYLEQAVLTDAMIEGVGEEGVTFVVILTIPDSYTNYRVKVIVTPSGKKSFSL